MSLINNSKFDKVHVKFCKQILRVLSKACNLDVLSELGRTTFDSNDFDQLC